MTPADLAVMLSLSGPAITAAEVSGVLAAHPAFSPDEDGFILGRPADVRAIISGTRPEGLATGPVPDSSGHASGPVSAQEFPEPAAP
jgi:hypothetical protein